ncbi:MAG: LysR family transcriptional regulator [Sandarakinorhabdus sp.]|jgi:DNA-binding transcriptional LysR family regulator|nr:LysR family transcriptional regulator [Sandarakinorhabdus sp.]
MDRLSRLELFLALADSGSFTRAAQAAGCSPTAASRAIAALEASLGTSLFRRSTRQVALTDAGAAYRDRLRPLLAELAAAGRATGGEDQPPSGELAITAPTMFGRLHVLPVVADLLAAHPALSVRLLLIDRNVRLIEEGIDVAVRIGPLADSSFKAVRIGSVRPVIVASPPYLARHGVPATAADLKHHHLIATTGPRAATQWRLPGTRTAPAPRLTVTTVEAAVSAAQAGIGLASLLSYQVADALKAGQLIELLPGALPGTLPIHLLFDGRTGGNNGRGLFVGAMKAALGR